MNTDQLRNDLAYVRQTVSGSEQPHSPAAIPLFWAAIIAVGFPMVDLAPHYVGWFWGVAGPAGFLVSCAIGWWSGRQRGQLSRSVGMKYVAHWAALLVTIFLAVGLVKTTQITAKGFGALILLLLAVVYFLGGVHLEPRLRWVSLVAAAGYVLVLFVSTYVWTIVGAALALTLVLTAMVGGAASAEGV